MSTIHRKTVKGQAEVEMREFGLSPRLRPALVPLLAEGFIEEAPISVQATLESAAAQGRRDKRPDVVRREAARYLIDKLGPTAEGLAIKLECAPSVPEVQQLLVGTAQMLRAFGRKALADEFVARFVTPLQG